MTGTPSLNNEITEVAIAVVEHGDLILIGQRPLESHLGGMWEFPGGKVQPDESAEAAACRECREETGLDVHPVAPYPTQTHTYSHGTLRLHFYRCKLADPTLTPLAPFVWIPRASLSDYAFPEANRPILALIAGEIKRGGR